MSSALDSASIVEPMAVAVVQRAHDAGYVHGLMVVALLFGAVGLVVGALAMLAWVVREDTPADPRDQRIRAIEQREDRRALRDELPPSLKEWR
jgi:hypothetical protein